MMFTLQKVQCWSPGTSFNVFLEKSAPIDIAALSDRAQYVQVGPYKVKLEIIGKKGLAGLKIGNQGLALADIAEAGAVSGSVFVFMQDGVETTFDGVGVLGSASGCFEIHW
jgi:hypothetical protein